LRGEEKQSLRLAEVASSRALSVHLRNLQTRDEPLETYGRVVFQRLPRRDLVHLAARIALHKDEKRQIGRFRLLWNRFVTQVQHLVTRRTSWTVRGLQVLQFQSLFEVGSKAWKALQNPFGQGSTWLLGSFSAAIAVYMEDIAAVYINLLWPQLSVFRIQRLGRNLKLTAYLLLQGWQTTTAALQLLGIWQTQSTESEQQEPGAYETFLLCYSTYLIAQTAMGLLSPAAGAAGAAGQGPVPPEPFELFDHPGAEVKLAEAVLRLDDGARNRAAGQVFSIMRNHATRENGPLRLPQSRDLLRVVRLAQPRDVPRLEAFERAVQQDVSEQLTYSIPAPAGELSLFSAEDQWVSIADEIDAILRSSGAGP
jgi:hypothetical protein